MAESKKSKKIVDVAHPGKTTPPSSSKPVIVTNRPILKDPMVVEGSGSSSTPSSVPAPTAAKVKITPITDDSTNEPATGAPPVESTDNTETPQKDGKTIADLAAEATERAAKKDDKKEEPSTAEAKEGGEKIPVMKHETKIEPLKDSSPKPDETPVPATTANTEEKEKTEAPNEAPSESKKPSDEKDEAAAEAEAEKREAELQKLVESKKYFLSINSVEKRRTKRVVVVGILLSLLLALAWADIALDAGLVKVDGVKPVTHLFSN